MQTVIISYQFKPTSYDELGDGQTFTAQTGQQKPKVPMVYCDACVVLYSLKIQWNVKCLITELWATETHPRKQRVETVDLLPFSHVGVVLSDALQGQLLHQVDLIRLLQVLVLCKTVHFCLSLGKKKVLSIISENEMTFFFLLTMNFCTLMGNVAE